MIDWKTEISRLVYWKQVIADGDQLNAYPWHLPKVAASASEIALAESVVGCAFSSQYIDFLRHANGWPGFVVTVDMFGTTDFLEGRSDRVMEREELRLFIERMGISLKDCVPIGASEADLDVFLHLSPNASFLPGGVLWFANEEVDRYNSFDEFFMAMVDYNARIAEVSPGDRQ